MSSTTEAAMSYPASNGCRFGVIGHRSFVLELKVKLTAIFFMKVFDNLVAYFHDR